jgi:uncharacterized protein (DUF362 family)
VKGTAAAAGLAAAGIIGSREVEAAGAQSLAAKPPKGYAPLALPGRVTKVTVKGDLKSAMQPNQLWPKLEVARKLLEEGMKRFTGAPNVVAAMKKFIHPRDIVAIKLNGIAAQTGHTMGTNYELVSAVVDAVLKVGVPADKITVFEQYPTYLTGCRVNVRDWKLPESVRTDTHNNNKMGSPGVPIYQGIKTKFCTTLTEATAVINLPLVKDHGICGYTGALKNITHGCNNNPQDFHAHQASPQIALLYNHPIVRSRMRLHIKDGFKMMFDRGPLDKGPRTRMLHGSVYVATDPVALDTIGTQVVEAERKRRRIPSLKEARREPRYLKTASELGLGVHDLDRI